MFFMTKFGLTFAYLKLIFVWLVLNCANKCVMTGLEIIQFKISHETSMTYVTNDVEVRKLPL